MSLVRLVGFSKLGCGCLVGRYREEPTERDVLYIEEKGVDCRTNVHRRNHAVRVAAPRRHHPTATLYARLS